MTDRNHSDPAETPEYGKERKSQRVRFSSSRFNQEQPPIDNTLFNGLQDAYADTVNIPGHNRAHDGYQRFHHGPWPSFGSPFVPPVPNRRAFSPYAYTHGSVPPIPAPPGHKKQQFVSKDLPGPTPYIAQPDYQAEYSHLPDETTKTFSAVNPFLPSGRVGLSQQTLPVAQLDGHAQALVPHDFVYPYLSRRTQLFDFVFRMLTFVFNTLPRELYLQMLLRMPAFYFSRVARIFEEAQMTMSEIEGMALEGMDPFTWQQQVYLTSPTGANLKSTWEGFIDSLLREWKTLNIVSVLLLSAILTTLQIESAGADPITRNCALLSLICALMSLLYGCMYIVRFSNMRKPYKALEWAQETQKTKAVIWWNTWVLLAMPATWLAWSLILYITCIMAFVWRTGTGGIETVLKLSPRAELGLRIAISAVLSLGVIYFALILNTLLQYGDSMDKNFQNELELLVKQKKAERRLQYGYPSSVHSRALGIHSNQTSYKATKVMDLVFFSQGFVRPLHQHLVNRGFEQKDWDQFIAEETLAWDGDMLPARKKSELSSERRRPQDDAALVLEQWNKKYFKHRGYLGLLCREYLESFPGSYVHAIYLVDISLGDGQPVVITDRFGPVPRGLTRIDIFDNPGHDGSRKNVGITTIFATASQYRRPFTFSGDGQYPKAHSPLGAYRPSPYPAWPAWDGHQTRYIPDDKNTRLSASGAEAGNISQPWADEPYQYPPTRYHPVDIAPELVDQFYSQQNASPTPDQRADARHYFSPSPLPSFKARKKSRRKESPSPESMKEPKFTTEDLINLPGVRVHPPLPHGATPSGVTEENRDDLYVGESLAQTTEPPFTPNDSPISGKSISIVPPSPQELLSVPAESIFTPDLALGRDDPPTPHSRTGSTGSPLLFGYLTVPQWGDEFPDKPVLSDDNGPPVGIQSSTRTLSEEPTQEDPS